MGGGAIYPNFENSLHESYYDPLAQTPKPFVGFIYEHNLNKPFSVAGHLNYSRNKILQSSFFNLPAEFSIIPKIKFVQISIGGLVNYKIFSELTNSTFLNGFKIGVGLNIDTFRDFEDDNFGFITVNFSHKDDRYQVGMLYQASWEYKKFRLNYNLMNSMKMFGNHRSLIQSTDWRTLSASYIYTLSE